MTGTLTDRYVWAVQRSLPEAKRADIDQELRGSIADAIDAKQDAGATHADAEREAIVELGDPYRLAAGYADRPLYLIGPELFPDYIRLLKVLYAIVLPIVVVAIVLGQVLSRPENLGTVIGPTFAGIIAVAAHLGFWTTLVFALVERAPDRKKIVWSPDTLPQLPTTGSVKLSDVVSNVIWILFGVGAVLWAQFISDIPVFDPALWSFWLPYFGVLAVALLAFQVVLYRMGRWSILDAVVNAVLALAFTIPALWLILTEQAMNPAFLERAGIAPLFAADGVVTIIVIIVLVLGTAGTIIDGVVKAIRARRSAA